MADGGNHASMPMKGSSEVAKTFKTYRDESKVNWGYYKEEGGPTSISDDKIMLGCVLRIADATEAMARNYTDLLRQIDFYKQRYEELNAANNILIRSNRALRSVIKKLKGKK